MRPLASLCALLLFLQVCFSQNRRAEDYYVSAFNEMSDMLAGRDSLSIKRAVFLAEWAYYEGKLDYKTDFCDEIDRIKTFIRSVYAVNKLHTYKTGMQMAISSYMVSPFSGNNYTPYTYDFETYSIDNEPLDLQFVTKTLKTHKGQCRSLPWMYKILANELNADVSLAHAPRHSYIMYKDEDKITPEEWINLELTTNPMNPNAWIIRGKSLERLIQDYLMKNNNIIDDYCAYLIKLMDETKLRLDKTYMTEETEEIIERRKQQAIEAKKYIQKQLLPK